MSAIYDKWERLVDGVLKKEQLWQLFHSDSVSPSMSSASTSDSSSFSFCHLTSSLHDPPFSFPCDHKQHAPPTPRILRVEDIPPITNPNSKLFRKRNLNIQVPKIQVQDVICSQECCPMLSPRMHSKWFDNAKQKSYPLPLPPKSTPVSPTTLPLPQAAIFSKSTPVSPTTLPLPPAPIVSKSTPVSPTISTAKAPPARNDNVTSPWKKGRLIGRGPLGNIYVGFNSEKGEMCAIKEACLLGDSGMRQGVQTLEQEIALLRDIKHPNIVQYLGSEMVGDNFYIYVEYVSGGSIRTILQEYGRLGEPAIRNYTQHILAGLAYLHSKDIGHWNIKAASVLVDPKGRVKLSSSLIEKHIVRKSPQSFLLDSPYWMAPEVITNSNKRNLACDIWSLGCTVLEMATAKPPLSQYQGVMAMFKVACQNELPEIPNYLSDVCKDFLRCCLQWNPLHRATASQLLDHPFVRTKLSLGKQMTVSSSLATNMKGDYARSPHLLPSKSSSRSSDIYTPRDVSAPVSPVGSPLLHPASPQQLKREMSGPSKSIIGGIGTTQPPHLNQAKLLLEASKSLAKQSKSSSPSYWDPNILQAVFRFS